MATNVIFTRGNTATINATAIKDGQILYNTTAGTQYLDNGTTRIQVGQNITVDTTLNSLSNNPIANRGVAGVMMSSLSSIALVTQAGSLPDALAVKELNSNINLYVGTDKKLHFVNGSGADSALPFNPGADFDGHYYSGWQSYQCLNQTITFGVPDTTHKNYVVTFTYAESASFSVSGCTTVEKMQYNYTVGSNTVYVCTFIITDVTASTLFSVYGYGTSVGYRVFCGFD